MLPLILYFRGQSPHTPGLLQPRSPHEAAPDLPETAVGRMAVCRMLLPDHVGSRKPAEPAMEGRWAKSLLTGPELALLH